MIMMMMQSRAKQPTRSIPQARQHKSAGHRFNNDVGRAIRRRVYLAGRANSDLTPVSDDATFLDGRELEVSRS